MKNQNKLEVDYLLSQLSALNCQINFNLQAARARYPKGAVVDGENVGGQFRPLKDKAGSSNDTEKPKRKRGQNTFATGKKSDFSEFDLKTEEAKEAARELSFKIDTEEKALEALSKRIAYLKPDEFFEQEDEERSPEDDEVEKVYNKFLEDHNLEIAGNIHNFDNGFNAYQIKRKDNNSQAIVFTGTDDLADTRLDVTDSEVGRTQFEDKKEEIKSMLQDSIDESGHLPAVSGHSLGGALSQMAAVEFPDMINSVTTFNSASISAKTASKYNDPPEGPPAKLVYSENDVVPHLKGNGIINGSIKVYEPKQEKDEDKEKKGIVEAHKKILGNPNNGYRELTLEEDLKRRKKSIDLGIFDDTTWEGLQKRRQRALNIRSKEQSKSSEDEKSKTASGAGKFISNINPF